jgi:WXG100 family type VII secretion target
MAGQIKLTPSELRSQAVAYTNGSSEIDGILKNLTTTQNQIAGNWSGSSFQKFDGQFKSLVPKVQQFSQLLKDINTQLKSVADIIEDTDNQIAKQINAL